MPVKRRYSFTGDLKLYETCPRQYQFFREYDFTPSRSAVIFFGLLVHQSIEEIHRRVMDGKLATLNETTIRELFDRTFHFLALGDVRPIGSAARESAFTLKPFTWRRNLPLLNCKKTIFNLVATFNDFEKAFAKFLERCSDILRFASLGTTEQESGAQFRVDYLKPSGAIGFYYPDWVVVQKIDNGELNWIIETKGRVWESTPAKDAAIADWCKKVSAQTKSKWRYKRIDQRVFWSRTLR
jgi:hypothetical protein